MTSSALRKLYLPVALISFCIPAVAQSTDTITPVLPRVYQHWLDEDVRYIITKQERTQYTQLKTDAERDAFVVDFWERRNPEPGSSHNAFKEEHYRRLAYANEHFAAGIAGWQTDRGHVYILYGPPDAKDIQDTVSPHFEVWEYKFIDGGGKDVELEFVDKCSCGKYKLVHGTVNFVPPGFDHLDEQ